MSRFKENVKNVGKKVFVAMSGGVDSSVAAALLKKEGYDVTGVFMKNWSRKILENGTEIHCTLEEDYRDALAVARKLNIPLFTFDFEEEYRRRVFDYFIDGYKKGLTPNPDVMCNKEIKFGLFLKRALAMGADYIATGHYARLRREIPNHKFQITNKSKKSILKPEIVYKLLRAKDKNKDQSYFLCLLAQDQLRHCLFPIGDYIKNNVRRMAREFDLPTAGKKDSQGLCFVGKISVPQVLENSFTAHPGLIVSTKGKILGYHRGFEHYTIGQRGGLGLSGGPYYVAEKRKRDNAVVVARGADHPALFQKEILFGKTSWTWPDLSFPLRVEAQIRYRQNPVGAAVEKTAGGRFRAAFEKPVRAVAPGQIIVLYKGEEVLGGGVIL